MFLGPCRPEYAFLARKRFKLLADSLSTKIAKMQGVDVLEAEAVRRAHEGVTKPIFHGGKRAIDVVQNPVGSIKWDETGKPIGIPAAVRDYSDTLLIFLLKGRNPAAFGDRLKQEHSGPGSTPIPVIIMPCAEE
jgi:hypothetical protein